MGVGDLAVDCGSKGCALGWATTIPELAAMGLKLVQGGLVGYVMLATPADTLFGVDAAAEAFGLELTDSCFLFYHDEQWDTDVVDDDDDATFISPHQEATPREVADHIRRFVELVTS